VAEEQEKVKEALASAAENAKLSVPTEQRPANNSSRQGENSK
jgi:hypothetical protein